MEGETALLAVPRVATGDLEDGTPERSALEDPPSGGSSGTAQKKIKKIFITMVLATAIFIYD